MVGTAFQKEKGIEDSPDLAFADWVHFGQGSADEEWARFYIEHTSHELYEWLTAMGVAWVGFHQQEGNTVPRWHNPLGRCYKTRRTIQKPTLNPTENQPRELFNLILIHCRSTLKS